VSSSSLFEAAVETAQRIWRIEPVRRVRMPEPDVQQTVEIDVLWTDGGLRPRANNLAFLIQQVSSQEDLKRWKQRLKVWTVRGGLLVLDELYLVQPRSESSGELEQEELGLDSWYQTLVSPKPHLFTPKALANLRQGQLSLADLEETVSERSFTFLTRQQSRIDTAFQQGIDAAIKVVQTQEQDLYSARIQGHIIRYSIAYLAARILQDKNFFIPETSIRNEDQDPVTLLNRMIDRTNGFFSRAKESEEFIYEHTRSSFDRIRQELVQHMGYNVSFVLTDHRDVGRLYEEAIKKLPRELGSDDWGDLNRHYTPVKLAERMLEALPLERIRPEERFIFDPAAGSGSLLLAATSRLAGMTDIPTGDAGRAYLRSRVAGNDLDRYANLIAQLRYFLASESLGIANKTTQISGVLPFPNDRNFTHKDYNDFQKNNLPIKPRVIIANPPFAEQGNTQKAAKFLQKALSWLDSGSYFGFVLPQSFLTATTHGVSDVRTELSESCHILEAWQFPEGVVGTNARQSTCVLLGSVGKSKTIIPTISRAYFSGAKIDKVREYGFLGTSWVVPHNFEKLSNITAPPVLISVPTVPLGNLFYVFTGVNPGSLGRLYPPMPDSIPDVNCKRHWRLTWRGDNRLLADPNNINPKQKWIRYGSEYLESARLKEEEFFSLAKILVGRKVNRNSLEPLVARLDNIGFCPNNDVYCVLPVTQTKKHNRKQDGEFYKLKELPENWMNFSFEEQRLWLLGILSSKLLTAISLIGRNAREVVKNLLLELPLPQYVDTRIINVSRQIILKEQRQSSTFEIDKLRMSLNEIVEESYGNPQWLDVPRIGISPGMLSWQQEPTKTLNVTGQVLHFEEDTSTVLLRLSGLLDDNDEELILLPQELPGWALDGTVFRAELSEDIETFQELAQRPWALRKFRHTPYPYLNNEELQAKLGRMTSLENR
jgi:hypothetical protein